MTARRYDRFIVLADMRTGSNFLEANLNALPGLHCHGEAFNPNFVAKKDHEAYLEITLAMREADPLTLLQAMDAATEGLAGFRFFQDHDPRVLAACLADRRCAKVVLTRNPLESYISLKIARATDQWKLSDARRRRAAQAVFDGAEFERHLAAQQDFQLEILHGLQTSGQTAFYIGYEDINDLAVLNGLAEFLGIEERLSELDDKVKKQNPEPLEDLVENPEAMASALARLDRFNLSRTPNFEPRRGPAIPGHVAAAGAPLLFLPIRGAPEATVLDWLARLGPTPGLLQQFNRKSLRDWQRTNPGARSFTVLRHPLSRAHVAFTTRILSGEAGAIRNQLKRQWKLDLPQPDKLDRLTPEAHADAFLKFLQFLKGNLAGQTSVRIDASWASQSAVLQGFASQITPDLILREERLAEGLAFLAAELGVSAPTPSPDPSPHALSQILTAEHQAAAREAYARDYLAFGFGDWAPLR